MDFFQVHHHHKAEEDIYFPWISTKAELPEKLTKDHTELLAAMENLKKSLSRFKSKNITATDDLNQINMDLQTLIEDMEMHLTEEEELVPDLLRMHFTEDEHTAQISRIAKSLGFRGNASFLPLITHALRQTGGFGPTTVETFNKNLPLPVRLLNKYWFTRQMKNKNLLVLESFNKN